MVHLNEAAVDIYLIMISMKIISFMFLCPDLKTRFILNNDTSDS